MCLPMQTRARGATRHTLCEPAVLKELPARRAVARLEGLEHQRDEPPLPRRSEVPS